MIRIRAFQQRDMGYVCALVRETFLACNSIGQPQDAVDAYVSFFTPNTNADALRKKFNLSPLSVVAVSEGRIIGMLRGDKKKLSNIFILPSFQKMGVGDKLIKKYMQEARKKRSDQIRLNAVPQAVAFYKKYGFKKTTGIRRRNGLYVQPMKLLL